MQREAVESKSVRSIGYCAETQVLEVEFASGRTYRYLGVPATAYAWLQRAKSKGTFINRLIKDRYPFEAVHDASADEEQLIERLRRSLRERGESPPTESSR